MSKRGVGFRRLSEEVFPNVHQPTLKWWVRKLGMYEGGEGPGNPKIFNEQEIRKLIIFHNLRLIGVNTDTCVRLINSKNKEMSTGVVTVQIDEEKVQEILKGVGK